VTIEQGERLSISIRLRRLDGTTGDLRLAAGAPDFCKLRREDRGTGYWLDINIPEQTGSHSIPMEVISLPAERFTLSLGVKAVAGNLIASPGELDLGDVSLEQAANDSVRRGRLGIRTEIGTFKITSVSSTLPFLRFEQQTIIDGSNYLVQLRINRDKLPKPGAYSGTIVVETDSGKRLEVPVKIKLNAS
jgi:hypothetical protein